MSKLSTASAMLSTAYLENNRFTEIEAKLRTKIINEIAHVDDCYKTGFPKSGTAIIVEILAIIKGN